MTTTAFKVMATTFVMSLTLTAWAQPPDDGPPRGRGGQPGKGQQGKGQFGKGQQGKGQQGKGQQDGRPRFQLGTVIPPQMRGDLNLTSSQEKEINGIEKDVKTKLEKILSKDQIDSLNNPPMGGGPGGGFGQRDRGGPGGPPNGPEGDDAPPPKKKFGQAKKKAPPRDEDN
ncbi:MAG: hypothetical protein NT172_06600 [Planctomycetota bacterium]|nr:hypothetical protein [Planctomycetota bacterium]RLS25554.1 MAG: hypothetical protein DWH73_01855 [Planctomycetota bacterium]